MRSVKEIREVQAMVLAAAAQLAQRFPRVAQYLEEGAYELEASASPGWGPLVAVDALVVFDLIKVVSSWRGEFSRIGAKEYEALLSSVEEALWSLLGW